jgi:hypothetical protein
MLLYPLAKKLQQYRLKNSGAALVSILLVYYKIKDLQTDLPEIEVKIKEKTDRLQLFFFETTDISEYEQEAILEQKKPDIFKAVGKAIKNFLVKSLYLLLEVFIVLT